MVMAKCIKMDYKSTKGSGSMAQLSKRTKQWLIKVKMISSCQRVLMTQDCQVFPNLNLHLLPFCIELNTMKAHLRHPIVRKCKETKPPLLFPRILAK